MQDIVSISYPCYLQPSQIPKVFLHSENRQYIRECRMLFPFPTHAILRAIHQGMQDIVSISYPCYLQPLQIPKVFLHSENRQYIRECRMLFPSAIHAVFSPRRYPKCSCTVKTGNTSGNAGCCFHILPMLSLALADTQSVPAQWKQAIHQGMQDVVSISYPYYLAGNTSGNAGCCFHLLPMLSLALRYPKCSCTVKTGNTLGNAGCCFQPPLMLFSAFLHSENRRNITEHRLLTSWTLFLSFTQVNFNPSRYSSVAAQ